MFWCLLLIRDWTVRILAQKNRKKKTSSGSGAGDHKSVRSRGSKGLFYQTNKWLKGFVGRCPSAYTSVLVHSPRLGCVNDLLKRASSTHHLHTSWSCVNVTHMYHLCKWVQTNDPLGWTHQVGAISCKIQMSKIKLYINSGPNFWSAKQRD